VASIYEGTSGIQAQDFVRRKLLGDDQQTMGQLLALIEQCLSDPGPDNPWRQPLADILALCRGTLARIAERAEENPRSVDAGAYAMLRLCGLLVCGWNALVLCRAATEDTAYQQRLKKALQHFSTGAVSEAKSWSEKALIAAIDYDFNSR
jgi:acyl-CoA dehydrogenase